MATEQSFIQKLQNGRASHAFDMAENGIKKYSKEYKSLVKSVPMMIKSNGLGATIAFLFSKSNKESREKLLCEHIREWLDKEINGIKRYKLYANDNNGNISFNDTKDMLKFITELNSNNYGALTIEILAYFTWLRRFAEGLCQDE